MWPDLRVQADDIPLGEHAESVVRVEEGQQFLLQELLQHGYCGPSTTQLGLKYLECLFVFQRDEENILNLKHLLL